MHSLTRPREDQTSPATRHRLRGLSDAVGIGLFAGAGAWMIWASAESGGSAARGIGLLLACGLALVAARSMGSRARLVVPAAALLAAIIVAARSKTGVLSTAPLSGPFEYVNADGAFYVQAAMAGLMLASSARPWLLRVLGAAGAGFFAVLPFMVHALAAAWLVLILSAIALGSSAVAGARGARVTVVVLGLAFVGTLGATILLGAQYRPSPEPNSLQRTALNVVEEDRLIFWHEAFSIMRDHPRIGVGPGRYQVVSPIARSDPDDRWAHNEFLQQGAEGGVIGLVLLALIFVWAFSRLWMVTVPDPVTALSAASLAALGIHASIDHVMHFPAIPIMAAGLVGIGMIDRRHRPPPWEREQTGAR